VPCRFPLVEIVLLDHEVVHELYAKVRLRLDVILHVDHAIDLDVNREAVRGELGRDFLVDLDEHVVAALDDGLLGLLLADTVRQAQLIQGDL